MRDRRRDDRLEAVFYGGIEDIICDPEETLRRIAKSDPRLGKVIRSIELSREFPDLIMGEGKQAFLEPQLPMMTADYAAVAPGAATETVLWTPNDTTQTHTRIKNGTLDGVKSGRIRAGGIVTTPAAAGTILTTPRYGTTTGGVTLGPSVAVTGTNSQTNVPWLIQWFMFFRSFGATATMVGFGTLETGALARDSIFGGTTATVDTTAASGITFSQTDSVAAVSWTPKGIGMDWLGG